MSFLDGHHPSYKSNKVKEKKAIFEMIKLYIEKIAKKKYVILINMGFENMLLEAYISSFEVKGEGGKRG